MNYSSGKGEGRAYAIKVRRAIINYPCVLCAIIRFSFASHNYGWGFFWGLVIWKRFTPVWVSSHTHRLQKLREKDFSAPAFQNVLEFCAFFCNHETVSEWRNACLARLFACSWCERLSKTSAVAGDGCDMRGGWEEVSQVSLEEKWALCGIARVVSNSFKVHWGDESFPDMLEAFMCTSNLF